MLYPIGLTKYDLSIYDKVVQEHLKYRPIQAIDRANLDTDKPASFIASLGFNDNIRNNIKFSSDLKHTFLTVCGDIPNAIIKDLIKTELTISLYDIDILTSFCIISASVYDWYQAITLYTQIDTNIETRRIMNQIIMYLEQMGFKALFENKKKIKDGTYIL